MGIKNQVLQAIFKPGGTAILCLTSQSQQYKYDE